MLLFSTRIKDAGIAIRHSRGRILCYTAVSSLGLEGVGGKGVDMKQVVHKKMILFVTSIETYIEDVKQDEKDVPDLLESIMRPTDAVREELRQKLFKRLNLDRKSRKYGFQNFGFRKFKVFPPEANTTFSPSRF